MSSVAAKTPKLLLWLGIGGLSIGIFLLLTILYHPLKEELKYQTHQLNGGSKQSLTPSDTTFSIVIPKIGAVAPVVMNVNPNDPTLYQSALARGVAHAQGTALPTQRGNMFLFAHSSADLFTASRYNSVFYLIHHLKPNDEIIIWYNQQSYRYTVVETKIVPANATQYLFPSSDSESSLTLMTCWPPGTTYRRLIVIAKPVNL